MTEEKRIVSCAFCQAQIEENQSLKIREYFLCSSCERKIVKSSVWDLAYPSYVERIKEFWLNKQ